MSRYQGYSEPIEVLIDILNEQKKQTLLLEKIATQKEVVKNVNSIKPKNPVTRKPSNKRSGNSTK